MRRLTEHDLKFLSALKQDGSPTGNFDLPLTDRVQDRARTRAKKHGWALFDRKVWAWRITPAGLAKLAEERS